MTIDTLKQALQLGPSRTKKAVGIATTTAFVVAGVLVIWSSYIHLHLWQSLGYRHIATIGPLFLLQFIGGFLVGVLIIGSGGFTHDLRGFRGQAEDAPEAAYAQAFAEWTAGALLEGRTAELLDWRRLAPEAQRNHPTPEHFLPLFIALGAGSDAPARQLHRSTTFGILRMDAFTFG